jgi:HAD superfamily hydrolase (TIGR01509 family)
MKPHKLGIIFDFNGVIINDERFHEQSWREMYQDKQFTEEDMQKHIFGKREKEIFEFVVGRPLSEEELSLLSDNRIEIVKKLLSQGIAPTPGLIPFLQLLQDSKIDYIIATSSRKPYIRYILELLQLTGSFSQTITAEDVAHGKPNPEVFLKAAAKIQKDPKHCVVFEDTHSGIEAAKRAGMKVVALTTTHPQESVQDADLIVPDFTTINLEVLTKLFH